MYRAPEMCDLYSRQIISEKARHPPAALLFLLVFLFLLLPPPLHLILRQGRCVGSRLHGLSPRLQPPRFSRRQRPGNSHWQIFRPANAQPLSACTAPRPFSRSFSRICCHGASRCFCRAHARAQLLDVITACLVLKPSDRPSSKEVLRCEALALAPAINCDDNSRIDMFFCSCARYKL